MKDLLPATGIATGMLAQIPADHGFWERIFERWGIAAVSLALLWFLAKWTAKREDKAQEKRDKQDEAWQAERVSLLSRNNELLERQITQANEHSHQLKTLIKETNKQTADHAAAVRMMTLKFRRPCIIPDDPAQAKLDFDNHERESD